MRPTRFARRARFRLDPTLALCCALALACLTLAPARAQEVEGKSDFRASVEGSDGEWYVDAAGRERDARVAEHLGRRALLLRNSTNVIRAGVEFTDGTIEFDVAPTGRGNFVGILFRREAFPNQENIYLRIHRSGLYNAVQYAPRVRGSSTWQLYPEFNATAELPRDRWTRVRVEVRGTRLEVFLDGKPVLAVARLRGQTRKGAVAFWARVNDQPEAWAAALSNITIKPATTTAPAGYEVAATTTAPPEGTLTEWEVAGPVAPPAGAVTSLPAMKDWRAMRAEESGLVNLNRAALSARGRRTLFARTTVKSAAARTALLELGYSDDVTVFLNGEPVYSGVNGFESRHPEYLGFVKPGFENIYLRLRPGDNELLLAVTDDQRFGWGFTARLK